MLDFLVAVDVRRAVDVSGIQRAEKRANDRYLFRAAAAARKEIIRNLRFRRGPSSPGSPPNVHQRGRGGLRLVRFDINRATGSALVGPVKFSTRSRSSAPIPAVLEGGGTSNGQRIEARPYVGPAFDKVKPILSKIWAEEFVYTGFL